MKIVCVIVWIVWIGASYCDGGDESSRIINGFRVSPKEFPFYAVITRERRIRGKTVERLSCGSSIITRRHLLTSSHCLPNDNLPELKNKIYHIYAGEPMRNKDGSFSGQQRRTVKRIFAHPGGYHWYDIAVIEVDSPFNFTDTVQPIQLSGSTFDRSVYAVGDCYASGYGLIKYHRHENLTMSAARLALKFRATKVTLFPNSFCRFLAQMSSYLKQFFTKQTYVCAATLGGNAVCYGDSGGPVTCKDSQGKHRLIGIPARLTDAHCTWGIGAHARVSRFRKWVTKHL